MLAQAFNTVSHPILLKKIVDLRFSQNIIKLLQSYLSDRRQLVALDGIHSDVGVVKDGVPQGSVLGPSLFICSVLHLLTCNFEGGSTSLRMTLL